MLNLRSKHITKFGSPLSRALYFVSDQEGLVQMDIDLELAKMYARGVRITPELKSVVKNNVKQRKTEYHNKVDQAGIPDKIKNLLLITEKAQVEQYARKIVLAEYDLFMLIHNCSQIHFTHRSKFRQYVPDHLRISDTDTKEMKTNNPKRFFKKMDSGLLERRYIHVHLFESGPEWHCFYFSHQDIAPAETNHWKYGCHLHYVSHLWPKLKKRWIWDEFNKRSTEISGSFHIKFEPFEFSNLAENYLNNGSEPPPWALNFDLRFANGCGSIPLPVAHLATRGAWITETSLRHEPA